METDPKPKKKSNSSKKYMKFSGIAFQLAFLLFFAIWAGGKVDFLMKNKSAYMTTLFVVLAFGGFMYNLFRDLENLK